MQHQKYAIHTFNKILFNKLKLNLKRKFENHFELKIEIFIDGPSFLEINWHFFATSHDKGAVTIVGDIVKNHLLNVKIPFAVGRGSDILFTNFYTLKFVDLKYL